jgi:hypothetical protein
MLRGYKRIWEWEAVQLLAGDSHRHLDVEEELEVSL